MTIKRNNAFTVIELLVAMGLLTIMLAISAVIFRMAVKAQRRATATGEIMQKLRSVTGQLDSDFNGLRKDGEIFLVWVPRAVDDDDDGTIDRYERLDRIVFFASGDNFHTYLPQLDLNGDSEVIWSNTARICYMLGGERISATGVTTAQNQEPSDRTLMRSQHVYTADQDFVGDQDPITPTDPWPLNPTDAVTLGNTFTLLHINNREFENISVAQWLQLPTDAKEAMLTLLTDIGADVFDDGFKPTQGIDDGLSIDRDVPETFSKIFCQGMGDFGIQVWHQQQQRWVPQILNDNGNFSSPDIFLPILGETNFTVTGRFWQPPLGDVTTFPLYFGRAMKFTFTLYDSRGIFKEGKTFTHIVYLD